MRINCLELSPTKQACLSYRKLQPCDYPECRHYLDSNTPAIVATMPQAEMSTPAIDDAKVNTPEPNTEHPDEPKEEKKKDGRGRNQKRARWCPDLEEHVYNVTCQRRYRGNYCLKPCDYKIQLDKTAKARELHMEKLAVEILQKEERVNPEPVQHIPEPIKMLLLRTESHTYKSGLDWTIVERLLCQRPEIMKKLREAAEKELREVEAQLAWELIVSYNLHLEEDKP